MSQTPILEPIPALGRFLTLGLLPGASPKAAIESLARTPVEIGTVVGLGAPLVLALGKSIEGLRAFPGLAGPGVTAPSTQGALWFFAGGDDAGDLVHRARRFLALAGDAFHIEEDVFAFRHGKGLDLSGFEDGTENPKGDFAREVAVRASGDLAGSSFVASQRWVHDLARLERLPQPERDLLIGRRFEGNEEIADAPPSAHVKRSAQESFSPAAFMLRRSMPFGTPSEHGFHFVAYGASLDPFERVLRRMVGLDDGIVDGLFKFTRPVSGAYYWCPALHGDRLDLRPIGL